MQSSSGISNFEAAISPQLTLCMIKLKEGDPSSACKVTTPVAGFGSVNLPLMVLKLCAQMIHGSGLKGYHFLLNCVHR